MNRYRYTSNYIKPQTIFIPRVGQMWRGNLCRCSPMVIKIIFPLGGFEQTWQVRANDGELESTIITMSEQHILENYTLDEWEYKAHNESL